MDAAPTSWSSGPGSASCCSTPSRWSSSRCRCVSSSASGRPGWWSGPTCPGRSFWRPLFVAPLAVPAFVNSYAWVGVIPSLHGLWAGVLVTTLSYFPFMYLPVAATLRRLDPAVEESARALGSDSAGVFFRVVLPAAAAGDPRRRAADRRAPARRIRRLRDGALRHLHRRDLPAVPGHLRRGGRQHAGRRAGAAVPGRCLVAEALARGTHPLRPDRLGRSAGGDPDPPGPQHNTRAGCAGRVWRCWRSGCRCGRSCAGCGSAAPRCGTFDDIGTALGQTIGLAPAAAVLTTVLAFPVAWVAVRSSGVLARAVEGANYITSSLPGIVTALALVTVTIHCGPAAVPERARSSCSPTCCCSCRARWSTSAPVSPRSRRASRRRRGRWAARRRRPSSA